MHKGLVVHFFERQSEFEKWLEKHQHQEEGIWLKFAKKASGHVSINYVEAREVALMYGWIDGLANSLDEKFYLQKFTQRRKRSKWSKINTELAENLIVTGKMQPRGLAEVEAAKADGRWEAAYAPPSEIEVPDYFIKAIKKNKAAYSFFKKLNKTNLYAVAFRLHDAKREDTKKRLTEKFIGMFERGEKIW